MSPTKTKSISSPPGEVERLRKKLKEKEDQEWEGRFARLEERVDESMDISKSAMKQATEHRCSRPHDFTLIDKSFAEGREEFKSIRAKIESMSSRSFWSIVGGISAIVIAGLIAMYNYGRNESKWEQTTDRVQKVEVSAAKIDKNVNGLTTSFRLMEQKLEETPKKVEEAVRNGMKKNY